MTIGRWGGGRDKVGRVLHTTHYSLASLNSNTTVPLKEIFSHYVFTPMPLENYEQNRETEGRECFFKNNNNKT